MCGIFGYIIPAEQKRLDTFRTREYIQDTVEATFPLMTKERQSPDGSGLSFVDSGYKKAFILKQPVSGGDFVKTKEFEMWRELPLARVMIAHVRKATVGSINQQHTHPIQHGKVVVVHNGCISNHIAVGNQIPTGFKPRTDLDSEVVASYINWKLSTGMSTKEAITAFFKQAYGAQAIALINEDEPDNLYLWRNTERPISILYNKQRRIMWFASVPLGLRLFGVSKKYGICWNTMEESVRHNDVVHRELTTNTLYIFNATRPLHEQVETCTMTPGTYTTTTGTGFTYDSRTGAYVKSIDKTTTNAKKVLDRLQSLLSPIPVV